MQYRYILFFLFPMIALAQGSYKSTSSSISKSHTFTPREAEISFDAEIINLEAPSPSGDSYKSFLLRQKARAKQKFKPTEAPLPKKQSSAPQPRVHNGMPITIDKFNGLLVKNYNGGIPNDNSLAVSNDGIVLAAINSALYAYDSEEDSILFPQHILPLSSVAPDINGRFYDPKLIYDEHADRFILIFLKDNNPNSSHIIACFSSSNNPLDEWYCYEIPGNPLNNNRWTDFPAINITEDELFITGNLIIPDVSWQVGFDGSVIWQIRKEDGYNNQNAIRNRLYFDIRYDGNFTRNIHPVRGVKAATQTQYFMSNRNFDLSNDTLFLMQIDGTMDDPDTDLEVKAVLSDQPYGVPPNAIQADTDTSDPSKGLQTNDARVLGAITDGEWIQFVSTTRDFNTGRAAIYHGEISDPMGENMQVMARVISEPNMDLGYPNIAYTGNEACDKETIIGVNYTSADDFPGVATFYQSNSGEYSEMLRLKEGEDYVDRHQDSYERWGDYFGLQPKFNEPGKVWSAGFWGMTNNLNGTWINELSSPDSSQLLVNAEMTAGEESIFCEGSLKLEASGGTPPYYFLADGDTLATGELQNLCDGDTVNYLVVDARGCRKQDTVILEKKVQSTANLIYPNPSAGRMALQFNVDKDQIIEVFIHDSQGRLVKQILKREAKAGLNELHFNLDPLETGTYFLSLMSGEEEIMTRKILKTPSF